LALLFLAFANFLSSSLFNISLNKSSWTSVNLSLRFLMEIQPLCFPLPLLSRASIPTSKMRISATTIMAFAANKASCIKAANIKNS
jgi:hypothetical protein